MSMPSMQILSRYHYDPLDRLVIAGPSQRFYQAGYLATELDDQGLRSIMRHAAQPLAQQRGPGAAGATTLLATDLAQSPLLTLTGALMQRLSYTGYGYAPAESGLSRLLGFNGECPDRITGHYLLGNGKRAFNPVLMRFNSPDELSPFEEGGLNPYAYCAGDPINFSDPTGNVKLRIMTRNHDRPQPVTAARATPPMSPVAPSRANLSPDHRLDAPATSAAGIAPSNVFTSHASEGLRHPTTRTQYKTVPTLGETKTHVPRSGNQRRAYKTLLDDAQAYDRHVKNNPNFTPIAPEYMVERFAKTQLELNNANSRNTTSAGLNVIRIRHRDQMLHIKQYVVRNQIRQDQR